MDYVAWRHDETVCITRLDGIKVIVSTCMSCIKAVLNLSYVRISHRPHCLT